MEIVEVEKPIKDVNAQETQEQYLERTFELQNKESKVDFKSVGGNNYRINFWAQRKTKESLTYFKESYISRSYYAVLTKKGLTWKHKIL